MKEEQNFLKTITLLMRLTREGKLEWKDASLPALVDYAQSQERFETELADIRFCVEHAPVSHSESNPMWRHLGQFGQYRLVVEDPDASSPITSPPMKAAKDLVSLIHSVEEKRSENLRKRLAKVNERLEAAS